MSRREVVDGNARDARPVRYLARRETCRYCGAGIVLALCRDGRWRTFDDRLCEPAAAGVWAWRRRLGMEETNLVPGHRLHFCAEYADAHGPAALGNILGGAR